jgi:hypothetical protein
VTGVELIRPVFQNNVCLIQSLASLYDTSQTPFAKKHKLSVSDKKASLDRNIAESEPIIMYSHASRFNTA